MATQSTALAALDEEDATPANSTPTSGLGEIVADPAEEVVAKTPGVIQTTTALPYDQTTEARRNALRRGIQTSLTTGGRALGFQGGQIDFSDKNLRPGSETDAGYGVESTPVAAPSGGGGYSYSAPSSPLAEIYAPAPAQPAAPVETVVGPPVYAAPVEPVVEAAAPAPAAPTGPKYTAETFPYDVAFATIPGLAQGKHVDQVDRNRAFNAYSQYSDTWDTVL